MSLEEINQIGGAQDSLTAVNAKNDNSKATEQKGTLMKKSVSYQNARSNSQHILPVYNINMAGAQLANDQAVAVVTDQRKKISNGYGGSSYSTNIKIEGADYQHHNTDEVSANQQQSSQHLPVNSSAASSAVLAVSQQQH